MDKSSSGQSVSGHQITTGQWAKKAALGRHVWTRTANITDPDTHTPAYACLGCGVIYEAYLMVPTGRCPDPSLALRGLRFVALPTVPSQPHEWATSLADADDEYCRLCLCTLADGPPECPEYGADPPTLLDATTQKAMGVFALVTYQYRTPPALVVQRERDLSRAVRQLRRSVITPLFARPCPAVPRHGFVASRQLPVGRLEDVVAAAAEVLRETKAADPAGELLLMPLIHAELSAVWRPGLLVFGPGNDGATSGRDSRSFPLVPRWPDTTMRLARAARVGPTDDPYIEAVYSTNGDAHTTWWTQVRAGPRIAPRYGPDYIPYGMVVERVVQAKGDLLEWEKQVRAFGAGTVVYHPGGSLSSHYAIHCVLHGVPLVVSHRPRRGEYLVPSMDGYLPPSDTAIVRGIGAASALSLSTGQSQAALSTVVSVLHNSPVMQSEDGFWIGAAAMLLHRLGLAAILCEARHAQHTSRVSRQDVLRWTFGNPLRARRRIARTLDLFQTYPWPDGFGGDAWADCAAALLELDTAIRAAVVEPDAETITRLIECLNRTVNLAHNSGWWLNKFGHTTTLNDAALGDPRVLLDAVPILDALTRVPQSKITRALGAWRRARPPSAARRRGRRILEAQAALVDIGDGQFAAYVQCKTAEHVRANAGVRTTCPSYTCVVLPIPPGAEQIVEALAAGTSQSWGSETYDYTPLVVEDVCGVAHLYTQNNLYLGKV